MNIILASASPRRKMLLSMLGLPFQVMSTDIDESLSTEESLEQAVVRLASAKGLAVASNHPDAVVISADTLVACDTALLGKPANIDEARDMLKRLSGRWHTVATGFCLRYGTQMVQGHTVTSVAFTDIDDALLEAYLACGEAFDKAGAYAIQGKGSLFVRRIQGDFYNVVGLPITEVAAALRKLIGDDAFLSLIRGNNA